VWMLSAIASAVGAGLAAQAFAEGKWFWAGGHVVFSLLNFVFAIKGLLRQEAK